MSQCLSTHDITKTMYQLVCVHIFACTLKISILHSCSCIICITCRPPKLYTKSGKVKFHPKSVNSEETAFENKFMIYYTMVKSSAVFIHDCSMIPPYPLLFFGGDISMLEDEGQEVIAVDHWIKFQAPRKIAELVKVCVYQCVDFCTRSFIRQLKQ